MKRLSLQHLLLGLVIATVVALYVHAHWMGRTLRIDNVPGVIESAVDDRPEGGKTVAVLERRGDAHILHCHMAAGYQWPFCELDIRLGPGGHGMDLTAFDSIRLNIATSRKGPDSAVRVFLRNFDPTYSKPSDGSSLKPHEVAFEPSRQTMPVELKLSQFMVSSWWMQEHPTPLEELGPQLENITMFAVATGGAVQPGDYDIVLESAELHGLWISKATFRLGIIVVWLICIVLHLALQWRRDRFKLKETLQESHDLHHHNEALEARVEERTRALSISNSRLIETLQNLEKARDELVQTEKYAALGTLVSGVAHELNTPIGNALLAASTLSEMTRKLEQQAQSALTRSALNNFIADCKEGTLILDHNLRRAATLILSFKQLAADQHSGQRRNFRLRDIVDETVLAMAPMVRKSGHTLESDVPADIAMNGYPGPLSQIIINLVNNSLMHAFGERRNGRMRIEAQLAPLDMVELRYSDNGAGMAPQVLARVFEPFFTTKLGTGGSGLGLHLVHNFVTQLFGGSVSIESQPGRGTTLHIMLPLRSPNVNELRARLGVPADVAEDYERFLAGREPDAVASFDGPHSRRDVVELALFQREMRRLLPEMEIELVRIDSYANGIEQLRLGRIAALATTSWRADLEPYGGDLILSDAFIGEGQSVVGLYTSTSNERALKVRKLEDLRALRVVSNRDWSVDWQTLESLGVTRLLDVKTWRQMAYMVRSGEADVVLSPFPAHSGLEIKFDDCVLVPIPRLKVKLAGTRHFAAAHNKAGEQIAAKVFPALAALARQGAIDAALLQCGFLNPTVETWTDIAENRAEAC
ncbi:MAG TPA: ATP-binding protein [Burkholderiaceae bacterium]